MNLYQRQNPQMILDHNEPSCPHETFETLPSYDPKPAIYSNEHPPYSLVVRNNV